MTTAAAASSPPSSTSTSNHLQQPHPPPPVEPYFACAAVNNYERLNRIGEGTYGTVYRGRDRLNGRIVALKKLRLTTSGGTGTSKNGFPLTSIREIKLLRSIRHQHIVELLDCCVGRHFASIFLVFEYVDYDAAAFA